MFGTGCRFCGCDQIVMYGMGYDPYPTIEEQGLLLVEGTAEYMKINKLVKKRVLFCFYSSLSIFVVR